MSVSNPLPKEHFDIVNRKCDTYVPSHSSTLFDTLSEIHSEIIDVTQIEFDDEKWLYSSSTASESPVKDVHKWLKEPLDIDADWEPPLNRFRLPKEPPKIDQQKYIDTRTFTRPKKRFTRPSIEKFNEQVYGSDTSSDMNSSSEGLKRSFDSGVFFHNAIQESNEPTHSKPLDFDLGQPTNSYYFENMLANVSDMDTFQNMSPPSLVNSMCSSTFANLMESSFIKNDPVLREIRDTDFTESILLQDSEPPMFQSFTESCSSINSDTAESFLKKVTCNNTFRKNSSNSALNSTIQADGTYRKSEGAVTESEKSHESPIMNGTYRRPAKKSSTFTKADRTIESVKMMSKFSLAKTEIEIDDITVTHDNVISDTFHISSTVPRTLDVQDDEIEEIKKHFSDNEPIRDSNRWSQIMDEKELDFEVLEKSIRINNSTGSADSLDRISSLSNSSRGSSKIYSNMAEVDAIVEQQAQNLQIMSTPKPNAQKSLIMNNCISPIKFNRTNSDSEEESSTEDFKSVRSSLSKLSLDNYTSKSTKSIPSAVGLKSSTTSNKNTVTHNTHTIVKQKSMQNVPTAIRGSYSNLNRMSGLSLSHSKINRPAAPQKSSNLKTISHNLKGSYTSLRPINTCLPVAPPINPKLNTTATLTRASNPNVTQIVEHHVNVAEVCKEKSVTNDRFVKPQPPPRMSGLPRPVSSGIPRPSMSKIPGPRTSSIRPPSRPTRQYTDG